jgi:hypothetical protein
MNEVFVLHNTTNNIIIYFILLIIIIIIYFNLKNDNITYIKNSNIIINNKKIINNTDKIKNLNNQLDNKKSVNILQSNTPALRGYIDEYRLIPIGEKGGSKPFNNIIIHDDNLVANKVNYNKYESYRKKPLTINNSFKKRNILFLHKQQNCHLSLLNQ